MQRKTQTLFYCDNCDCVYEKENDCYVCEQADRIIDALIGCGEDFRFLEEGDWGKESSVGKKAVIIDKLRPVFESLWGENGTHKDPRRKKNK